MLNLQRCISHLDRAFISYALSVDPSGTSKKFLIALDSLVLINEFSFPCRKVKLRNIFLELRLFALYNVQFSAIQEN